jgi:hypothetical protein
MLANIKVKEPDTGMITPSAPRARNTSDINESDARTLIASFASLDLITLQTPI